MLEPPERVSFDVELTNPFWLASSVLTGIEEKSNSPNDDADVCEVARLEGDSRGLCENFPIDDGVEGVVQPSAIQWSGPHECNLCLENSQIVCDEILCASERAHVGLTQACDFRSNRT